MSNRQQQCRHCLYQNDIDAQHCEVCDQKLADIAPQRDDQAPANITNNPMQCADNVSTVAGVVDQDMTIAPTDNSPSGRARPPTDTINFNLAGDLAQFEVLEIIGQGGMGAVYRAKDLTLHRDVALKMLRAKNHDQSTTQASASLLLNEARTVCKLNHRNIVTVFDVARAQDSNFIVMEWIDGLPLDQVIPSQGLTVATALDYAIQIVDGISCAHRSEIIHSDIKPQNIMLTDQGTIKILDFGIAGLIYHHQDSDQHTKAITNSNNNTKGFSGTPGYVSPEQARGRQVLDQRSDIFSFGTVLYQMLTGKRAFNGSTGNERNQAVMEGDYLALSPQLPVDLRAIVNRCLATNAGDRYQSASQIHDDLERYRRGEPISIIDSRRYWLKKKLHKHKWPVLLLFLLSLGVITELTWQQYQAYQQHAREQLLTTFTGRVESLEAKVQLSRMAPRHDISAEAAQWQREITALTNETSRLGAIAHGPGHYAIGRMHYALQQYEQALENLQQAWSGGFKQTRVAYHLALSHGALYQRQKAIISNMSSRSARKDRMEQLDKQHREPAIEYLEQGMSGSPYQSYAKALLQFYQDQGDEALNTLAQAKDLPVWFYQHHLLRGDIYLAKAQQAGAVHNDKDMSTNAKLALGNYAKALQLGRSDLQLQLKPIAVYFRLIASAAFGQQQHFATTYKKAMVLLDHAIEIDPESYRAYFFKGRMLSIKSSHENQHSGQPLKTQQQAIAMLEQALKLSINAVDKAEILLSLGLVSSQKIKFLQDLSLPVEFEFATAMSFFDRIPVSHRDYFFFNSYANLLHTIAIDVGNRRHVDIQQRSQSSPQPGSVDSPADKLFNQTIETFQRAIELQPKRIGAKINAASTYLSWAEFLTPVDAQSTLRKSIERYQNALQLNSDHFVANYYLGRANSQLAQVNNMLFASYDTELSQAKAYLTRADQLNFAHPFVRTELAKLDADKAIYQWQSGLPHQAFIDQAIKTLDQSLKTHPDNALLLDNKIWLKLVGAQLNYVSRGTSTNNKIILAKKSNFGDRVDKLVSTQPGNDMLLRLLTANSLVIEQQEIDDLPTTTIATLAKAVWYSQNGYYQRAEHYFNAVSQYYPALLWHYRLEHLRRWIKAAEMSKNDRSFQQLSKLKQQVIELTARMRQHYPTLIVTE